MNKKFLNYWFIVVFLSLLPVIFPLVIKFLNSAQSYAIKYTPKQQLNANQKYSIDGQVVNYQNIPGKSEIFLNLLVEKNFSIFSLPVSFYSQDQLVPIKDDGTFLLKGVPEGNYKMVPKTIPFHGLFFTREYPLKVPGYNPKPLKIDPPKSSLVEYLKEKLLIPLTGQ